ncbi:MAG TPA: FAD-binding protein, partial [Gammaproteobacteria bacterium]|nr:FAD-binding protein [Gammaproteobacteria bacterium]
MPDQTLIAKLSSLLGDDGFVGPGSISERYHVDFRGDAPCEPAAVLRPDSVDELAEAIEACAKAGQPVAVQGGMTGPCGGSTPQAGEIAISLERLDAIEEVDRES